MRRIAFAILLLASCAVSCGKESPTAPAANLGGTYTGVVEDGANGSATVTAEIVDVYGALTGTWKASGAGFLATTYYIYGSTYENDAVRFNVSRNLAGETWSSTVNDGGCIFRMNGVAKDGAISGTYDTYGCATPQAGGFRLTR